MFQFGKYLGNIDLTFHQSGGQYVLNDESDVTGQPILLDSSIVQDPEILAELNRWEIPVSDLMEDAVGQTLVTLDGKFESCRRKECNMGNFITDAILKDQHIRAVYIFLDARVFFYHDIILVEVAYTTPKYPHATKIITREGTTFKI